MVSLQISFRARCGDRWKDVGLATHLDRKLVALLSHLPEGTDIGVHGQCALSDSIVLPRSRMGTLGLSATHLYFYSKNASPDLLTYQLRRLRLSSVDKGWSSAKVILECDRSLIRLAIVPHPLLDAMTLALGASAETDRTAQTGEPRPDSAIRATGSDADPGEIGWWLATDGKWYPPATRTNSAASGAEREAPASNHDSADTADGAARAGDSKPLSELSPTALADRFFDAVSAIAEDARDDDAILDADDCAIAILGFSGDPPAEPEGLWAEVQGAASTMTTAINLEGDDVDHLIQSLGRVAAKVRDHLVESATSGSEVPSGASTVSDPIVPAVAGSDSRTPARAIERPSPTVLTTATPESSDISDPTDVATDVATDQTPVAADWPNPEMVAVACRSCGAGQEQLVSADRAEFTCRSCGFRDRGRVCPACASPRNFSAAELAARKLECRTCKRSANASKWRPCGVARGCEIPRWTDLYLSVGLDPVAELLNPLRRTLGSEDRLEWLHTRVVDAPELAQQLEAAGSGTVWRQHLETGAVFGLTGLLFFSASEMQPDRYVKKELSDEVLDFINEASDLGKSRQQLRALAEIELAQPPRGYLISYDRITNVTVNGKAGITRRVVTPSEPRREWTGGGFGAQGAVEGILMAEYMNHRERKAAAPAVSYVNLGTNYSIDIELETGSIHIPISAAQDTLVGRLMPVAKVVNTRAAELKMSREAAEAAQEAEVEALAAADRARTARRECPWCAELIKPAARVCRYCGRDPGWHETRSPEPSA